MKVLMLILMNLPILVEVWMMKNMTMMVGMIEEEVEEVKEEEEEGTEEEVKETIEDREETGVVKEEEEVPEITKSLSI